MTAFSRPLLITAGVATLALGSASSALGAGCTGRPGASALEQYCEAVPNADGSRQNPGSSNGGAGSSGSSQSVKTLQEHGKDGQKVAGLVEGDPSGLKHGASGTSGGGEHDANSTTPVGALGSSGGSGGTGGGTVAAGGAASVAAPQEPSGSPLKATKQAVASGPTAGSTTTWALVGMTVLGVFAALLLRRRSSPVSGDHTDAAAGQG